MRLINKLEDRAKRKGWSPEKLHAKLRRRERIRTAVKTVGSSAIRPVVELALNAIPGGALIGKALGSATGLIERVPVLGDVATVGSELWTERVISAGGPLKAALQDLTPAFTYIEDGEYGKAALSIGLLALAVAVLFI